MGLRTRAAALLSFGCALVWNAAAFALDWEIERNFRYFSYPSDVAVQRVVRDIFIAEKGKAPTPEESELLINGEAFWTTPLAKAGALSDRWPIDWPRDDRATVYDLVRLLRQEEGRPFLIGPEELGRLGWASLLAQGRDAARPTGYTATCWNPGVRLHNNCGRWGDYVRPPGWVVRVFDATAAAGQQCAWTVEGGAFVIGPTPPNFQSTSERALHGPRQSARADCREVRVVVPSDPADPKNVAGHATIVRTSPNGLQASLDVAPRDRLIVGFGDSFTSGEGNPERPAVFTGDPWMSDRFGGSDLPYRKPDPTSLRGTDTRAQWTDRWCHRSAYSWQIRSALYAALSNLHQSVTLLPYGCSGATILAGLLYEYDGVEWSQATDHNIVGSRAEFGLAYQEMCQPQAFRSPYCRRGDRSPWCGSTAAPSDADEAKPGFYDQALQRERRTVARCGGTNVFKRSADAVFLDIGINDVGFSRWASGLILSDGILRSIAQAFTPCFDPSGSCAGSFADTKALYDRLGRRYALLRDVLDRYLLPDFGVDPSHVIVPVYPPALENEAAAFCRQGNPGLTVATFRPALFMNDRACGGGLVLGVAKGVIAAYPADVDLVRDVEEARVKLNQSLADFALKPGAQYDVVNAFTPDFDARGVCATTDRDSHPPAGQACFTTQDIVTLPCAPGNPPSDPESMHAPRTTSGAESCLANNGDPAFFHPFPPRRFEPYRHRTRLYRTMDDVFMAINQRPDGRIDASAFGTLDLTGRTTGGAFHPTAEAHAIIANETAPLLCDVIGCGP